MGSQFQSLTAEKAEQSSDVRWQLLQCGGPGSGEHAEEKVDLLFKGSLPSPHQWPASATKVLLLKAPEPLKILPAARETIPRHVWGKP